MTYTVANAVRNGVTYPVANETHDGVTNAAPTRPDQTRPVETKTKNPTDHPLVREDFSNFNTARSSQRSRRARKPRSTG